MKFLLFTLNFLLALDLISQIPSIQWQTGLTGTQMDYAVSIKQTNDGGYITTGDSYSSDGDFTANHGMGDGWVSKLDVNGNVQWKTILGGTSLDNLLSVTQVSDGGYIVAGRIYSQDGDVSGFHVDPADPNTTDAWIVKLSSTGVIQWQKALGGRGSDMARCIIETASGYMIAGSSTSNDGDVTVNHGSGNTNDYWIIHLDITGNIIWEKTFGGTNEDQTFSITKTSDGAFVVAGMSNSSNGDVSIHSGASYTFNCWIIKVNASGILKWNTSFLVSSHTDPSCVIETSDKGFVISGRSGMAGNQGTFDALITKIDSLGAFQWQKSYGGSLKDEFSSVAEQPNGDLILSGTTNSNDGDVNGFLGGVSDCWIMRTDLNGNRIWAKTFGGSGDDGVSSVQNTTDQSFIVSGYSSSVDIDVTTNANSNSENVWIVKFNPNLTTGFEKSISKPSFSIFPNPVTNFIKIKNVDPQNNETYHVINTLGQYILSGKLNGTETSIDIQPLSSGFYTLRIGNEEFQSYKIIKD